MPLPRSDGRSVILVVEDEELLRLYAAGLLEEAGFEVLEAVDADAALSIIERRPDVHVLFTDIQLPGKLDGMELARKVHEQWPRILLLVTSGRSRPSGAEIADDGRFLAKPYTMRQLITEIDELEREAAARGTIDRGRGRVVDPSS
ncbi:MAG: response regulator [Hyphomicrobiales bacterium]|nr:response regulator [Hyphomicrobiales bacterium]